MHFNQKEYRSWEGNSPAEQLMNKDLFERNHDFAYHCYTCGVEHHSIKEASECCAEVE